MSGHFRPLWAQAWPWEAGTTLFPIFPLCFHLGKNSPSNRHDGKRRNSNCCSCSWRGEGAMWSSFPFLFTAFRVVERAQRAAFLIRSQLHPSLPTMYVLPAPSRKGHPPRYHMWPLARCPVELVPSPKDTSILFGDRSVKAGQRLSKTPNTTHARFVPAAPSFLSPLYL